MARKSTKIYNVSYRLAESGEHCETIEATKAEIERLTRILNQASVDSIVERFEITSALRVPDFGCLLEVLDSQDIKIIE